MQQFGQRESHIIHFGNTHEHGQLPLIVELSKRKEKKRLWFTLTVHKRWANVYNTVFYLCYQIQSKLVLGSAVYNTVS